ncbi:MAG: hypothetical protein ACQER5_05640 [Pseudomonadota bacterium]
MSLEQTIADLVAASNNLTGTINSKVNEIDQKVGEVVGAVPETIKGLSIQTFYIDAVDGDDGYEGSNDAPLKTINGLQQHLMNGSYVQVVLQEGQVHEVTGDGISLNSGNIRFTRWSTTSGVGRPTIKWTPAIDPVQPTKAGGYGVGLQNGSISFNKVDISVGNNGAILHDSAAFLRYRPGHVSVFCYMSNITLNDSRISTTSVGYCLRDVSLRSVIIDIPDNTNGQAKIVYCQTDPKGTVRLEVGSLSLPSGYSIEDLVDYEPNASALQTNAVIAA